MSHNDRTLDSLLEVGKAESSGADVCWSGLRSLALNHGQFRSAVLFVLLAGFAGIMALVYVPLRIFLTATERSRRFRLLQRIRKLRDQLGQPLEP